MVKRLTFFAYGAVSYLIFFATFCYAIAFVGGFFVPTQLDGAPTGPLGTSLAIDVVLLSVFAVQHSVMARPWFKRWWTQIVPQEIERSTYVLLASLCLILMFWQWRPLGGLVWSVDSPGARAVVWAVFAAGWGLVLLATFLINHFDLFGLRQVWLQLIGERYSNVHFVVRGPYRVTRHPLYLGFVLAFWAAPTMTWSHLAFAAITTAYILVAIQLEEHDLIGEHGNAYQDYRERVPMLIPVGAPRARR
jgi:protein-S-isoprenylcysteine O-methyltransferase Ste14